MLGYFNDDAVSGENNEKTTENDKKSRICKFITEEEKRSKFEMYKMVSLKIFLFFFFCLFIFFYFSFHEKKKKKIGLAVSFKLRK